LCSSIEVSKLIAGSCLVAPDDLDVGYPRDPLETNDNNETTIMVTSTSTNGNGEQKESVIAASSEAIEQQHTENNTTRTLHEILNEPNKPDGPATSRPKEQQQTHQAVDSTRSNWRIQLFYARGDYDECLSLIEQELIATKGLCEYGYHVKGLIRRHQGKVCSIIDILPTFSLVHSIQYM
jgi:hypothetical protein